MIVIYRANIFHRAITAVQVVTLAPNSCFVGPEIERASKFVLTIDLNNSCIVYKKIFIKMIPLKP